MKTNEAYQGAKRRVEAKLGFYIHLAIYVAGSVLVREINLSTYDQYLWFKWPVIGWGIGVAAHALGVFVLSGESAIKEKMIEREMEKKRKRSNDRGKTKSTATDFT